MKNFWNTTKKHLRRSPYQSVTALVTMFLTFLLGGIFIVVSILSYITLNYFESKPQITVFFTQNAGQKEADALTKTLESSNKTLSIKYVSKEDALKIYQEQNKKDPLLLEMVTADILPASLEISAPDPKSLTDLEPILKNADGVEEVVYQKDVVDSLIKWVSAIRIGGLALGSILAINAILITITVIAMKIALKRDEIEILRLIGATPSFIKAPFIMEGALYGVAGAGLAWVIISVLIIVLQPTLLGFLGIIPLLQKVFASTLSQEFIIVIASFGGIMVVAGAILGSVGSALALNRYLKI